MGKLKLFVGFDKFQSQTKRDIICRENYVDYEADYVYDDLEQYHISLIKGKVSDIVKMVNSKENNTVSVYTNSDIVVSWINNCLLLYDINKKDITKKFNLTPLNHKNIEVYEYFPEDSSIKIVDYSNFGFGIECMNKSLTHLFDTTVDLQFEKDNLEWDELEGEMKS